MGIGYFQLTVTSEQDKYLVGNPQFTYFKAIYKRHTNFALETQFVQFVGETSMGYGASSNLGKKLYANIPKNGDLLHRMYIVIDTQWCNSSSEIEEVKKKLLVDAQGLIDYVQIQIGDQIIDKYTGDWMHIYNETMKGAEQNILCDMIHLHNNINPNTIKPALRDGLIYIPLLFWFNRNPGLALPLLALQYSDIKINLKFNNKDKISNDNDIGKFKINNVQLLVEYIHLDKEEKNLFAQNNHEYLIEQLQYCNNINIPLRTDKYPSKTQGNISCSCACSCMERETLNCNCDGVENVGDIEYSKYQQKFELPFNHPIKLLFWTIQDDSSNLNVKNEPYIYDSNHKSRKNVGNNIFNYWFNLDWDNRVNQLIDATIAVNGQEIFNPIEANYFNSVQKYQYFENNSYYDLESFTNTTTPNPMESIDVSYNKGSGIYCYSFGLKPIEYQPSGSLNFSKLDKAELRLRIRRNSNVIESNNITTDCTTGTLKQKMLKVYAVNYNILRIMSGHAGLAFSN